MADIQSLTNRLLELARDYQAEKQRLFADARYAVDYRERAVQTLAETYQARALLTASALWGDVVTDERGMKTLNASAVAWNAQRAAEERLTALRTQARRANIDPEWYEISRARARELIANAWSPDELIAAYQNADPDVQALMAEFGDALIGDNPNAGIYMPARTFLKRQARARYDTPAYRAAYARTEQVADGLKAAHTALRVVINTLDTAGAPVANIYHAIIPESRDVLAPDGETYALPYFRAAVWGAVPNGEGGFYVTGLATL